MRGPIGNHGAEIDAARQLGEAHSVAAEAALKLRQFQRAQLAHRANSQLFEPRFRHSSHPRQTPHGQRRQKSTYVFRLDYKEPIGLAPVRGDFSQKLVGRNAGRSGQVELLADLGAYGARNSRRRGQPHLVLGYIQVGFVEREQFNQVGVALVNLARLA